MAIVPKNMDSGVYVMVVWQVPLRLCWRVHHWSHHHFWILHVSVCHSCTVAGKHCMGHSEHLLMSPNSTPLFMVDIGHQRALQPVLLLMASGLLQCRGCRCCLLCKAGTTLAVITHKPVQEYCMEISTT